MKPHKWYLLRVMNWMTIGTVQKSGKIRQKLFTQFQFEIGWHLGLTPSAASPASLPVLHPSTKGFTMYWSKRKSAWPM